MNKIYKTDVVALKKVMIDKEIETIKELSIISGINRNTLSNVLSGGSQPTALVMHRLVSALEIKPEEAGSIFFSHDLRNR